jgi:uncharacterized protein YjbI with pentapeptide repeats
MQTASEEYDNKSPPLMGPNPAPTRPADKDIQATLADAFETSKAAGQIYLLYMSFLAYCVLSVITTSDKDVITDAPIVLPLTNKAVSAHLFFVLAPAIAIGLFTYFEFFHCRLEGLLKHVRNRPGVNAEDHLYPGLLAFNERRETGFVWFVQRILVEFSLWWLLPVVLCLFTFWTIKKHDLSSTIVSVCLYMGGTVLAIAFWFRHEPGLSFGRIALVAWLLTSSSLLVFEVRSITRIDDGSPSADSPVSFDSHHCGAARVKEHWLRSIPSSWATVDIHGQDLSFVGELPTVHLEGGRLDGTNFQMVKFERASIVGASAIDANFNKTSLQQAHMQGVVLTESHFEYANLFQVRLDQSDLSSTDFQSSYLTLANLATTCAPGANFSSAILVSASFQHANLDGAKFLNANVYGANFSDASIEGAEFIGAKLQYSNFRRADLLGARLERADLSGAILDDAILQGADLRNVKISSIGQLTSSCTLFQALLDRPLLAQLGPESPLLKEPHHDLRHKCIKNIVR